MSSSLLETLGPLLAGDTAQHVSRQLGVDEGRAATAIQAAVPLLVSALRRESATPSGLDSLAGALDRDHDGSVLDDVAGFLGSGGSPAGDGILGHMLGDRRDTVAAQLGRSAGLDQGDALRLMALLAPLVMGALGRAKRGSAGRGGLADILDGAAGQMDQASPDLMSSLGRILDTDGDGSAIDDIGRIASGLGRLFGNKS